jgi:hypothetical protein
LSQQEGSGLVEAWTSQGDSPGGAKAAEPQGHKSALSTALLDGQLMRRRKGISGTGRKTGVLVWPRQQAAKVRGLAAINRVRRGESKTLSSAARTEGTSVRTIRRLLHAALLQDRPGGRIRVKAGDPYSARVEILTATGPLTVTAHGSRERELAGRHRATVIRVLQGTEPVSSLKQFRRKKIGGHELLSNSDRLFILAEAGELDQLDALYVAPETRG